jgi:hypothetical protein
MNPTELLQMLSICADQLNDACQNPGKVDLNFASAKHAEMQDILAELSAHFDFS